MQSELSTLFEDLMALCAGEESSFYFVEHYHNNVQYRVFTYRLASFTEFQPRNAIECRGHTFRNDNGEWVLACLPMQKFFNYGEHIGWGHELDLSTIELIMDKADGSLISTVQDGKGEYFLKSKTSFSSQQAIDAQKLLDKNKLLKLTIGMFVDSDYTVNMEYVAPDNQIVIGYPEPRLIILNLRDNNSGEYASYRTMVNAFREHSVGSVKLPSDGQAFIESVDAMTGIEGFVIKLNSGLMFKHKTQNYLTLHKLKDNVNTPRKLWEACILETSDDLRAMFREDPLSVARITDMEEKASKAYNHLDVIVNKYYNENKDLDRKSYAIKGQEEFKDGTFSLVMNLYLGRASGIKEYLIKNYKSYGISDVAETSD